MAVENIGGAIVRRRYSSGGQSVLPGTKLTREQLLTMPLRNLEALAGANFLDIFPLTVNDSSAAPLHVIHRGSGRYDVIQGHVLNAEALTREQAESMAGTIPAQAAA